MMGDVGKGDGPRDSSRAVSRLEYERQYDQINWNDSETERSTINELLVEYLELCEQFGVRVDEARRWCKSWKRMELAKGSTDD